MAVDDAADDAPIQYYVGHNETKRSLPITEDILHHAQDCNVRILLLWLIHDAHE